MIFIIVGQSTLYFPVSGPEAGGEPGKERRDTKKKAGTVSRPFPPQP